MKMTKPQVLCLLLFFTQLTLSAQQHFTISGYIRDAKNGEDLIGATVIIKELPGKGAAANTYGFFSLTVPPGTYHVSATFVGYTTQTQVVELNKSVKIDSTLGESVNE